MKCRDPILCYVDGNKKRFRHFSMASPIVKQVHQLVFNCGKCIFCRKKRAYELAIRCVLNASLHKENCFITLTYDETKNGYHNGLQYSDIQKFKKRLRRHCSYHFGKRIQIFNVHEYGTLGKKHWHLVIFNHDFGDKRLHTVKNGHRLYTSQELSVLWPFGFNTIGEVSEASAMYQAQYTQKDLKNGNLLNDKKAHSKHSAIGRDYFLQHYDQILSLGYIPFGGRKIPIPRYFQKLAHRHYSHFYEPANFIDSPERKKLYTKIISGQENKKMADLYKAYREDKDKRLIILREEWEAQIEDYIFSKDKPDFMISAENYLYDLKNKTNRQSF